MNDINNLENKGIMPLFYNNNIDISNINLNSPHAYGY
jgi:hypothetical protein